VAARVRFQRGRGARARAGVGRACARKVPGQRADCLLTQKLANRANRGFHAKTDRSQTDTPESDFAFFFSTIRHPRERKLRKRGNRRGSVVAELAKKKRTDSSDRF
jgi:hypothetical protein